uniref:Anti-CBASS protein Acb1 n=1 Tax=viral metagenome TaxID=1070528 RepID=A0A6C0H6Q5_9ZZZZ
MSGTYISCDLTDISQNDLENYCKENNINNHVNKFHTTIYSSLTNNTIFVPNNKNYIGIFSHFNIFSMKNGQNCLVMVIDCPDIIKRHQELIIEPDKIKYMHHITLQYNINDKNINYPKFTKNIYFQKEKKEIFIK